jgi:NAD(P)-dependent dehydrogenase (short-subunit alcohol dehydrogenase family)
MMNKDSVVDREHTILREVQEMTTVQSLFDLSGKKAMVVGGGGDLGGEMAVALAEAGADVAIVDIDDAGARRVAERVKATGRKALAIHCDATKEKEVQKTVAKVVSEFGGLHIAVNSQGIGDAAPALEMTEDLWDRVVDVGLKSIFLCAKHQGQAIKDSGGGAIINVASLLSTIAHKSAPLSAYCASKAGVVLLTKSLASELAPHNIRVNCISPGFMITKLNRASQEPESQAYKDMIEDTPLRRMGQPNELNGLVVFLASEASSFMTASDVVIDGGYTAW